MIGDCASQKDENGEDCTECKKAYFENFPDETYGVCTNWIKYKYEKQCGSKKDRSRCSTGEMEYCFMAYPESSKKKNRDPDKKCRTITEFVRDPDLPLTWSRKNNKKKDKGLCKLSKDPDTKCTFSWWTNDKRRQRGYTSLFRLRK